MEISKHGWKRLKQRMGLPKKILEKKVYEAFEKGVRFDNACGRVKRYIYKTYCGNKHLGNIRIHGGFIFLFDNRDTLVTVWTIPANVQKALQ